MSEGSREDCVLHASRGSFEWGDGWWKSRVLAFAFY